MLNRGEYPVAVSVRAFVHGDNKMFYPCVRHMLYGGLQTTLERNHGSEPVFVGQDVPVIQLHVDGEKDPLTVRPVESESGSSVTWSDVLTAYRSHVKKQAHVEHNRLAAILSSTGYLKNKQEVPELYLLFEPLWAPGSCSCRQYAPVWDWN